MSEATAPPWLMWLMLSVCALVVLVWGQLAGRLWSGAQALPRRRQRRVPWALEGASLAGLMLLGALFSVLSQLNGPPAGGEPRAIEIGLGEAWGQFVVFGLFASLPVLWLKARYRSSRRGILREDFGLGGSDEQHVRDFGLGIAACAAVLPVVYAVNGLLIALLGNPTPHPAIRSLLDDPSVETIAAAGMLAVIAAPLFEELAFRVLLQGGLQRMARRDAWWPVVVSSIAFGLAHTNQGFAPAPIIVLAIGLGYVYRQTHSYPAVIAMHMAFNALSLAVAIGAGQAGIEM